MLASGCATTNHHSSDDLLDLYTEEYVHYLNTGKYNDLKKSHRTFRKFIKAKSYENYTYSQRNTR